MFSDGWLKVRWAAISLVVTGGLLTTPARLAADVRADQPPAPAPRKVVFAAVPRPEPTGPSGNPQIYTVNEDGTDLRQLTFDESASADWPVWVMGGRKILYTIESTGEREDESGIYLMNADGTGAERLLATHHRVVQPKLAPDGSSVLFTASWETFPVVALYKLDLATGRVQNLTAVTSPAQGFDSDPRWSPDGGEIIFTSGSAQDGALSSPQVYTIAADGSHRQALTNDEFWYTDPAFAPGGRRMAASVFRGHEWPFPSDQRGKFPLPVDWHIVVQDVDTGSQTLITQGKNCAPRRPSDEPCAPDEGPSWIPVWIPGEDRIAFLSLRRQDLAGIYSVDANGGDARIVVELPGQVIIWHDWVAPESGADRQRAVSLHAATAPGPRLLFGALTYPTRRDPAGNFWADTEAGQSLSPTAQLFTMSAGPSDVAPLPWPRSDLAPDFARWTKDRSSIVFTASVPVDASQAPPRPGATVVPRAAPGGAPSFGDPVIAGDEGAAGRAAANDVPTQALDQVFVVSADGSGLRQITSPWSYDALDAPPANDPRSNVEPDVSPDGRSLVFANVSSVRQESWILRADLATGDVINLTSVTCGFALCYDRTPRFSPDGSAIAFASYAGGRMQIHTMLADGSGDRQVTDDDADAVDPSWSPDGGSLAYTRLSGADSIGDAVSDIGPWSVVVVNLATGDERTIASGVGGIRPAPLWGPDGATIAFLEDAHGQPDVYTVPATGGDPKPLLVSTTSWELFFDWR
ncbi:MAG TPA: hypothetical protein VFC51_00575 [Chloroflexota bacterium]|nr:hypothetical protein [Chloroflexota bacterium]